MLERTAATLESCYRQRILPSTTGCLKSRCQLHTSFWQHGVVEFELLDACRAMLHSNFSKQDARHQATRPTPAVNVTIPSRPLMASSFVLDFLCPSGAVALLRRLVRNNTERSEPSGPSGGTSSLRMYSTCTPPDPPRNQAFGGTIHVHGSPGIAEGLNEVQREASLDKEALEELLRSGGSGVHDRLWAHYRRLEPDQKNEFRTAVYLRLAESSRPIEAESVLELFTLYDASEWTEDIIVGAMKAQMTLKRISSALRIFLEALHQRDFYRSLNFLLAAFVRQRNWPLVGELADGLVPKAKFLEGTPDLQFEAVAALPGVQELFDACHDALPENQKANFGELLRLIAVRSINLFQPPDAVFLLKRTRAPEAFEQFIPACVQGNSGWLANDMYNMYRKLPNVKIRTPVMRVMVELYYHEGDAGGMERVLEDWYGRHERLERNTYRRYIAFYAHRGNVVSTHDMINRYKKTFQATKTPAEKDELVWNSLISMHARRGEVEQAREVFEQVLADSGRTEPTTREWNMLLNAFLNAGCYEEAIDMFDKICQEGKADLVTFNTLMSTAGTRGDLEFTLDLYALSRQMGISPDLTMMDALVEAYCQNERYQEAANLCSRVTRLRKIQGDYTLLWNTLLDHHADRRDLPSVHSILDVMEKHKLPYNKETYNTLIKALILCRQAHHALLLLRTAEVNRTFRVSADHYAMLMAAFLRTREPHLALKVQKLLRYRDIPLTTRRMTKAIEALGRWLEVPSFRGHRRSAVARDYFFGQALEHFRASRGRKGGLLLDTPRLVAKQFSRMVLIAAQVRDFAKTKEIIDLFQQQAGGSLERAPVFLLHSIMLADFYDQKYDDVEETWHLAVQQVLREARARQLGEAKGGTGGGVSPAFRYSLCGPLMTMQRVYLTRGNAEGLQALVHDLLEQGFLLDSKNWNFYVQVLLRLKRWNEAFSICEEKLMPQWLGWARRRPKALSLQQRRQGSSPRFLRPISYTLLMLGKEYLEIERLSLWSSEAGRSLNYINRECKKVINAITTVQRTASALERDIKHGVNMGGPWYEFAERIRPQPLREPHVPGFVEQSAANGKDQAVEQPAEPATMQMLATSLANEELDEAEGVLGVDSRAETEAEKALPVEAEPTAAARKEIKPEVRGPATLEAARETLRREHFKNMGYTRQRDPFNILPHKTLKKLRAESTTLRPTLRLPMREREPQVQSHQSSEAPPASPEAEETEATGEDPFEAVVGADKAANEGKRDRKPKSTF